MKKLISYIILGLLSFILIYVGHLFLLKHQLNYQEILIAKQDILPKTALKEEMFDIIKIPDNQTLNEYARSYKDIIDKYSSIDQVIYQNSFININALESENTLNGLSHLLLNQGQTTLPLPIDVMQTAGNSIEVGQKVNMYALLTDEENNLIVDLLIENINVLAIKDHNGYDLENINSTKIPYLINLGINDEYIPLIIKIQKIGEIKLYANDKTYNIKAESKLYQDSLILKYLTKD